MAMVKDVSVKGIYCTNLTKSYGDFIAVDSLSMRVQFGNILGFVGANGAGKTTTLRCMAGLIPLTSGEVMVGDIKMNVDALEAKRIACFVPDTPHLFNYLTVEEHLRFSGRIYDLGDIEQRMETLLEQFELTDKRDALPDSLSRGMRQKVAICMNFLHEPKAVFLDEPLTGLDPIGIRNMKNAIVNCAKEQNAAVIVSSHQLELIEEICDEIYILDSGRCMGRGTIAELHKQVGEEEGTLTLEELFLRLLSSNKD